MNEGLKILEGFEMLRDISCEEFVDLVTYKLYCYYVPDYHPTSKLNITENSLQLSTELKEPNDLKDFLEYYIEGKGINQLNIVWELLLKAYKPQKKGANGNMDKVIAGLSKTVAEKIGVIKYINETSKNSGISNAIKTTGDNVAGLINKQEESDSENFQDLGKIILLPKGNADFHTWDNIINNIIKGLHNIVTYKGYRAPEKIRDFIKSIKLENRGNKTVFINPVDFLDILGFIEFYKYLLNYLNTSNYNYKLAEAIMEYLPKLEIEGDTRSFNIQNEIFEKAEELYQ
nr:hypothetical protein [Candidatus Gracilibacteria bacterium]